jgi:dienelactone hydrolase
VPTLVLVGASDDWAPATACEQMVAGARGRSAQTKIVVYPGAYAEFDHPNQPTRQLSGLAFSADGSGRAHSGTNPAARADAIKRVPEWLAR